MTTGELLALYGGRGAAAYFGEAVTVTEHSLQAAHFAQRAGAPDGLVIAALLHDIGHLIEPVPGDIADWKTDARHELVGCRWLASRFGPDVLRARAPARAGQALSMRDGPGLLWCAEPGIRLDPASAGRADVARRGGRV